MNINNTITDAINDFLYLYDSNPDEIATFLTQQSFSKRQEAAINIIDRIMAAHSKRKLLRYVSNLARIEVSIGELEPYARDHVVHALLTYLLGIYLNEHFLKTNNDNSVNRFQWELASLLHDVGYPVQMAKDVFLARYTNGINEIRNDLGATTPNISMKIIPEGLDQLTNGVNSLDLIQNRINEWELALDARNEYENMISTGTICHGVISSLSVLHVIDLIYQKYNPNREYRHIYVPGTDETISVNQRFFENDIVNACTAIYLHNLPRDSFRDSRIDRKKAPLAYLLKVSDCLQEWERPSKVNQAGYLPADFEISIKDGILLYSANIPQGRLNTIRDELSSTLVATELIIRHKTDS